MRKFIITKNIGLLVVITVLLSYCTGNSTLKDQENTNWFRDQKWYKGLNITPHESINKSEFLKQYETNPKYWDEAFEFLRNKNLDSLAPGKYVIDSNNVIATVWEGIPKLSDSTNWEAHRNFNDLQYVIKGKAKMGLASIKDSGLTVADPYTAEDNETFSVPEGKYYDAAPGTFFIFSPQEIHRPAFKIDGYDSIKKIVIKVRVP